MSEIYHGIEQRDLIKAKTDVLSGFWKHVRETVGVQIYNAIHSLQASPLTVHQGSNSPAKDRQETITENGTDIAYQYRESGDPSGTPIVHLHGLVGSRNNFLGQLQDPSLQDFRHLAPNLYVHKYDPNFTKDKKRYNFDLVIDYLHRFNEARFPDQKVWLNGVSLGGEIAYKYAASHPEKVAGIILSGASGLQQEEIRLGSSNMKKLLQSDWAISAAVSKQFHGWKVPPILPKEVIEFVRERGNMQWAISFGKLSKDANTESNIQHIKEVLENDVPIYLVWGGRDRITPYKVVEKKFIQEAGIPKSHVYSIDTGHTPNIETPEIYNAILQTIIEKNSQQ